jgi:hypothetical protein
MTSVRESQENQRWSKRGSPQQRQANDSIDTKIPKLLVHPLYLLTSSGSLGLRQIHSPQQIGVAGIGTHPEPERVYCEIGHAR